jgi:hypothetical protein
MPEIAIRHCSLRIVRRGGWSWGEDPKLLVRRAVRVFGALLERGFTETTSEGRDIEIVAPVRLAIALNMAELVEATKATYDDRAIDPLYERLRAAIEQAVGQAIKAIPTSNAPEPCVSAAPFSGLDESAASPYEKLLKLLVAWSRGGHLERILLAVGECTVEDWHATLLSGRSEKSRDPVRLPPEFHSSSKPTRNEPMADDSDSLIVIDSLAFSRLAQGSARRVDVLRARIAAMSAAAVRSGASAVGPAMIGLLDRAYSLPPKRTVADPPENAHLYSKAGLPATAADPARVDLSPHSAGSTRTASATSRAMSWRPPVKPRAEGGLAHCALPFLMLGPLSRIGYFEALDALLAAADAPTEAAIFGTGLAYKVLEPPDRGWRRTPAVTSTAALFAGLAEPALNEALVNFVRTSADFLPALDEVIVNALAHGHTCGAPLLLCNAPGDGWLLAELDGVIPIAWSDSSAGILETVERFGRPRLLVPAHSSGGGLLPRLDSAGFRFLTDAQPGRNEAWNLIQRLPHERWWSNDADAPAGPLVAAGRRLGAAVESLEASSQELAINRPAVVPGDGGRLERSLALASAVALTDISWNIWRKTDDPDALLAVERFGDLEARVHFRPDEVRVKLPLGKRSLDLEHHGLLDDVVGVPWFGGRVVRFSGG